MLPDLRQLRIAAASASIGMHAPSTSSSSSGDAAASQDDDEPIPVGVARQPLSDYPRGTALLSAAEARADAQGFRPKAKKAQEMATDYIARLPAWRLQSRMDFVFENPLMGVLWDSDAIELLKSRNRQDGWLLARHLPTSYCHYGFDYQKPTNFFTSLVNADLAAPCPSNPCNAVKAGRRHKEKVAECSQSRANRVPEGIVHALLNAWVEKLARGGVAYKHLMVVDAFTGFGSVEQAAATWSWGEVCVAQVVSNDISKARDRFYNLDMGVAGNLPLLIKLGYQAVKNSLKDGDRADFSEDQVAVLIWLSTPCETYGPQGRGFHRQVGQLITKNAREHDAMNLVIAQWLHAELLSAPDAPSAAAT
jgi:hypothetical protein